MIPSAWRTPVVAALLAVTIGYGALLRLTALFDMYGPFAHPAWLVSTGDRVARVRPWLVPRGWKWAKVDQPYVGGDPINYIKHAREMRSFYQAHVREPVFLAATRAWFPFVDGQDVAVSLASLTFSVACIWAVYLVGAAWGSRLVGLGAAAALAIETDMVAWAPEGWRDEAFTFFVALTAWSFLRLSARTTASRAIALGLLGAAACLTRITAGIFIIPGLVWIVAAGERSTRRTRARQAGIAAVVLACLVAPYLINCARVMGDPFYALNYHTSFYRTIDGVPSAEPQSAAAYVVSRFRARPIATTDTAFRGLFVYPFQIKWHGFEQWIPGLGTSLGALAFVGLLLWIWQPAGRLLLVLLVGAMVPYMMTWQSAGGSAWRFTMPAYPFYLVAAAAAVQIGWRALRMAARDPAGVVSRITGRRVIEIGVAGGVIALLVSAGFWSPYLVARESLLSGDSTSIGAGPRDAVFFTEGWTPLVTAGSVVARLAQGQRSEIAVPLPELRAYRLVMRIDPVQFADAPPQRVRVYLDGQPIGTVELAFTADRVGSYTVDIPQAIVSPGRRTLEFVADYTAPLGRAGNVFPEVARDETVAFRLWYVRLTPL